MNEAHGRQNTTFEPNPHSAGHNRCMAVEAASERESWWVLQAQSGNREALNELFKSVQDPLFRYIVSLNSSRVFRIRCFATS